MDPSILLAHRLASANDLDAVQAIYMHARVVPYLGHDPMPRSGFEAVFAALVANGGFHVVEADGRIVGFYRVTRHEGRARHVAYFGTFAVTPEAHGGGIARAIVDTVIARLRADGVMRIELMLEADNPRAFAFYRKLGFELEGTMRAAYKRAGEDRYVDEWLMALLMPEVAGHG